MRLTPFLFFVLMALFSCDTPAAEQETTTENTETPTKGLKDYYADYFPIGVSVAPSSFSGPDSALIVQEFNSITPENIMKMGPIHPEEDRYNWEQADRMMAFAKENDLRVRGHALCWHQQAGRWMFEDENGNPISKEVLLQRLKDHIFAVAGRYKGQIYAWDVVNEAISDKPSEFLRNSKWYEICGEEFIDKAFEYAHEAVPDAVLFYNDYNAIRPEKRDRIIKLLKQLIDRGVPIHGVGIQGHWSIFEPSEQELRDALDAYSQLGLQVQITELDVSLYKWEKETRERGADESDAFTPELEQKQIEKYKMFFDVFREYKDVLTGVTFWNVSDHHTWLDNYPVPGRKNYPLLFDQERQRKKAYEAVTDF